MIDMNPIATLLNIPAGTHGRVEIAGRSYEYHAASNGISEGLYRWNPGHGVGNPCFSLALVPSTHHRMVLGQYLAGRQGVKRAEAEAIVNAASIKAAA